ncbi:hypothetical protein QBC45DRAFT_242576 [Copromyces sp. CBS 386.78]|nr:hypothetical protein QBC45DRAFT_242576 [Copromyces sp. CBS 386.78]
MFSWSKERSVWEFYHIRNQVVRTVRQANYFTCWLSPTVSSPVLVTQGKAKEPHPVTETRSEGVSYSHRIMKLSNSSWRCRRPFEYIKPTSYTPSVPFLSLSLSSSQTRLSTRQAFSRPLLAIQCITPRISILSPYTHSFIGSPLAFGRPPTLSLNRGLSSHRRVGSYCRFALPGRQVRHHSGHPRIPRPALLGCPDSRCFLRRQRPYSLADRDLSWRQSRRI